MIKSIILIYNPLQPVSDDIIKAVEQINAMQQGLSISVEPLSASLERRIIVEHTFPHNPEKTMMSVLTSFDECADLISRMAEVIGSDVIDSLNNNFFMSEKALISAQEGIDDMIVKYQVPTALKSIKFNPDKSVKPNEQNEDKASEESTAINPSHYKTSSGIECIDVVRHLTFSQGNAIKYIWRQGKKANEEKNDLQKANYYLNDLINDMRNGKGYDWIDQKEAESIMDSVDIDGWRKLAIIGILTGELAYAKILIAKQIAEERL